MSAHDKITRAKLVDGKVLIEQADGTYREEQGRTDWARLESFTEDDIERMAEEDADADWFPENLESARVVRPVEPVE